MAWELLLLGAVVYVPFLQRAFGTFSLTPADWALTAARSPFTIVPVLETVKWAARRGWLGELDVGLQALGSRLWEEPELRAGRSRDRRPSFFAEF